MANSICTKCDNNHFELKEVSPRDSEFILYFVQCTSCGGVIGVIDFYNIGELIHQLAKQLNVSLKR
ncbi:hypothetical protein LCGC14_1696520 [marine sediment metagenome]|uniref:Uncharacterized protein n=1 Tax=marine sediment metagenome TaxID=412755 RepID=A0A0F9KJ90_9ZZZZ|nr:hypothetical protein [Candidatus Aminicenantes bacterium]